MPKFIAKATPSLGNVSIFWSRMTESLIWPMGIGKSMLYLRDKQGGEIAEVRNGIVDAALEYDRTSNEVTHLFWIDDDVLPMPGALMELWALKTDIASGTYFLKSDGEPQPLLWPEDFGNGPLCPFEPDKTFPIRFCGMGLTLVRLDVYKRMLANDKIRELLGRDKYKRVRFYRTATENEIEQDSTGVVGSGYTEDYWFLKHAGMVEGIKMMGATTKAAFGFHVMPVLECLKCGFKTSERALGYRHAAENSGHRMDEDVTGFPTEQWKMWLKGEPITWKTPQGEVVWN